MVIARRFTAAALRRAALLLVVATALAACGGDDDPPAGAATPPPVASAVSGTAATGAPLPGLVVTLKDSTNRSVTATTSAQGAFTLDTTGLTPPYLLQVTTPGGVTLLSVSADANGAGTINITPISDLLVRSWYQVQGQSAASAFADPVALRPPSPVQVRAIARMLLDVLQLAIRASGAPITEPEDLIDKPFVADGTGIDALLDNSQFTVRSDGADLVLMAGSAVQTTTLAFVTQTTSITASSSTVDGTATSTATSSALVPVQASQVTALDEIDAALAAFAATVTSRQSALAVSDLEPFFAADLLDAGLNRAQLLAGLVLELRQLQSATLAVQQVRALDTTAGTAELLVRFAGTRNGVTAADNETFFYRRGSDGVWRFGGDGRIAEVGVRAEGRRNQGLFSGDNGPSVNIDVRPVLGTVSSVAVSGGLGALSVTQGATEVLDSGVQLTPFFANTGPLSPPLPAAGTPVTVTLQLAAGGSVPYTVLLNAFTTELIEITGPTGTAIAAGTATVSWTLPTTYAVAGIQLSALVFTESSNSSSGFQCISEAAVIGPTATTGQVEILAECNHLPVKFVNINLSTNGVNGERSQVIYGLSLSP
jgi:hypothetical protein